ncbi:MAG: hypothetical protein R6X14_03440, partial [bacterium]
MKLSTIALIVGCGLTAAAFPPEFIEQHRFRYAAERPVMRLDSLNCREVGSWPFGPADAVTLDPDRDLVFLSSGGGVYVLDASGPGVPVRRSEIRTRGAIRYGGLAYCSDRLYIAAGNAGMEIWDVSSAEMPRRLGQLSAPSELACIAVAGNHVYVVDREAGLLVVNVADPGNPQELGRYEYQPSMAAAIAVSEAHAYVADWDEGLRIINVADPTRPNQVAQLSPMSQVAGVAVSGDYAYVVGTSSVDSGLCIIDIRNPQDPVVTGYGGLCDATAVMVAGEFAYVTDAYHWGGELLVFDITDPRYPFLVGWCETSGDEPVGIALSGDRACLAVGRGLSAIDITYPHAPYELGLFDCPDRSRNLAVQGDHAYLVDWNVLHIVNISEPRNPDRAGFYDTPAHSYGVAVADEYAFVACDWEGLRIVDVSDPEWPMRAGHCLMPGFAQGVALFEPGPGYARYACVSVGDSGLRVIDVSDPHRPQEVGACVFPYAWDVAVQGNHAHVVGWQSFRVVDISDPERPHLAGSCTIPAWALRVAVAGNHACVAGANGGLWVLDISDPADPRIVGHCPMPSWTSAVAMAGRFAYVAVRHGLRVVDISDPQNPFEVGYYTTPAPAYGVTNDAHHIYVATWAGLRIIEFLGAGVEEPPDTRPRLTGRSPTVVCGVLNIAGLGHNPDSPGG